MTIARQIPSIEPTDPAVEAELDRLAVMPIVKLRVRYREVFRADPPTAFGPDLLRRSRSGPNAVGGSARNNSRYRTRS